ncbi:MAG TPA: cytochrome c [Candidatus Aquicultor sp.]
MKGLLATALALIVVGLIGLVATNLYIFQPGSRTTTATYRAPGGRGQIPMMPRGRGFRNRNFSSNGQQIFLSGTSSRDNITATGGPVWFRMHDGGCVTCHGTDGRGGTTIMMGTLTAPDIRYTTLTKAGFTDALLKRAITKGLDEKGGALDSNMPRWRMSDADLNDLIAYLKTLK